MTILLATVTLANNEQVDLFRNEGGFYWQSAEYREEDNGYFCEPVNGPFVAVRDAFAEARAILMAPIGQRFQPHGW